MAVILGRLLALNQERAARQARGLCPGSLSGTASCDRTMHCGENEPAHRRQVYTMAVWDACGWPGEEVPGEVDEDVILGRLLALNQERATL